MHYRAMTKKELAQLAGVSRNTFGNWLKRLAPSIPDYRPQQRLLTPAQVKIICESLCISAEPP